MKKKSKKSRNKLKNPKKEEKNGGEELRKLIKINKHGDLWAIIIKNIYLYRRINSLFKNSIFTM